MGKAVVRVLKRLGHHRGISCRADLLRADALEHRLPIRRQYQWTTRRECAEVLDLLVHRLEDYDPADWARRASATAAPQATTASWRQRTKKAPTSRLPWTPIRVAASSCLRSERGRRKVRSHHLPSLLTKPASLDSHTSFCEMFRPARRLNRVVDGFRAGSWRRDNFR